MTPKTPAHDETVRRLPDDANLVTNAVLTRGGRIQQGWKTPDGQYFETFYYPGALNFAQIVKMARRPHWAAPDPANAEHDPAIEDRQ